MGGGGVGRGGMVGWMVVVVEWGWVEVGWKGG